MKASWTNHISLGNTHRLWLAFGVLVLCLTGCTVGPDYKKPKLDIPDGWSQQDQPAANTKDQADTLRAWWTVLSDPLLENYIAQVTQHNPDLREAYYRIEESRAQRDAAARWYYPDVDLNASYSRSRQSEKAGFAIPGTLTERGLYSTGLSATWEPDVFGRIKRSVESAQANLEGSVDSFHDILISLYAEVASTYVELRIAQKRITVAQDNLRSQQEMLRLAQDRFQAGLTSELDVTQAKQNLADTEAQIPALRLAETQAVNRLAILLGRYPQDAAANLKTSGSIPMPTEDNMPQSLPADLLRQRPDIREAERRLAAQTARIGAATADLYPSFTLSGRFSLDAEHLSDAGSLASRAYSYGPGLSWNIFSANLIRNNIKMERARTRQAEATYERTVLNAVREVEDTLAAYSQESARREALQRSSAASEASVTLAQSLYQSGLTDFQTVLDAQRTMLNQQDKLVISQGQSVLDLIHLYRAFGGGWNPDTIAHAGMAVEPSATDNTSISER